MQESSTTKIKNEPSQNGLSNAHVPKKLPMPSKIKTTYSKYTRRPNPHINAPNYHPPHTVQLIEFTYCHDKFPDQAHTHEHAKYDPLTENIRNQEWKTNLLITIIAGVRGAIHEHSINKLSNLKIPKTSIKTLMKNIHQNAIKYLTYLVLNKRKLKTNKLLSHPPKTIVCKTNP